MGGQNQQPGMGGPMGNVYRGPMDPGANQQPYQTGVYRPPQNFMGGMQPKVGMGGPPGAGMPTQPGQSKGASGPGAQPGGGMGGQPPIGGPQQPKGPGGPGAGAPGGMLDNGQAMGQRGSNFGGTSMVTGGPDQGTLAQQFSANGGMTRGGATGLSTPADAAMPGGGAPNQQQLWQALVQGQAGNGQAMNAMSGAGYGADVGRAGIDAQYNNGAAFNAAAMDEYRRRNGIKGPVQPW